jgi:hypothetical protein
MGFTVKESLSVIRQVFHWGAVRNRSDAKLPEESQSTEGCQMRALYSGFSYGQFQSIHWPARNFHEMAKVWR